MPTYDYMCANCGSQFEIYQKITEGPKRLCPKCGKKKLKRLIGSGGGILFKGKDWPGQDIARKGQNTLKEESNGNQSS